MSNDYDIATPSTSMQNNCTSVALNFLELSTKEFQSAYYLITTLLRMCKYRSPNFVTYFIHHCMFSLYWELIHEIQIPGFVSVV